MGALIMVQVQSKKKKEKRQSIEEIIQCPECGSTHLIKDYSRAELVCEDCGLVIDEAFIDHGPQRLLRKINPNQKQSATLPSQKMAEKNTNLRCNRKKPCICTLRT